MSEPLPEISRLVRVSGPTYWALRKKREVLVEKYNRSISFSEVIDYLWSVDHKVVEDPFED